MGGYIAMNAEKVLFALFTRLVIIPAQEETADTLFRTIYLCID